MIYMYMYSTCTVHELSAYMEYMCGYLAITFIILLHLLLSLYIEEC